MHHGVHPWVPPAGTPREATHGLHSLVATRGLPPRKLPAGGNLLVAPTGASHRWQPACCSCGLHPRELPAGGNPRVAHAGCTNRSFPRVATRGLLPRVQPWKLPAGGTGRSVPWVPPAGCHLRVVCLSASINRLSSDFQGSETPNLSCFYY